MNKHLALLALAAPLAAFGANSAPVEVPIIDTIPAARDIPWPGTIGISVDATDVTHGVFEVTEKIPVPGPGPLTLLYPQWLPGDHSPTGTIWNLAGLTITCGGQPVAWKRDMVDMFAFHVVPPAGATSIEADYQFLSPTADNQGSVMTTPQMLNVEWYDLVLYPAGYYVRQIQAVASVKIPEDWKAASALEVASQAGSTITYKAVPMDTLVDSPVFAGVNTRFESLASGVRLDIFADRPEDLAATAEQIQMYRNLVGQAAKTFGAQHYDHYDFFLGLSDRMGGAGTEHHRSSENVKPEYYLTDWKDLAAYHDGLPHEYVHSWNGKFRRPADLWTPDYRTPMQDSLLWVYEGQTQFWGYVLAARSGLLSKEDTLAAFAAIAAQFDTRVGRTWRPLADTTNDPIISQRRPIPWVSWQRSEDYYSEGVLIWLDADSLIRQLSNGARSLDDFARAFFGVRDRDWGELTYTFDDVIKTLNGVQPFDWAKFFKERLDKTSEHAPLDGLTRGGYQLAYTETPSDWFKSAEKIRGSSDFSYSGGFSVNSLGAVTNVVWYSPAYDAGLTIGTKLIAVNGRAFDVDILKAALKTGKTPVSLLIRSGELFRTVELKYGGGLRYPNLVKAADANSLDLLLAPRP